MMLRLNLFKNPKQNLIFWSIPIILLALYINLDLLPLIGDESIRALVAIEMMLSGDYIAPTLNGELYFNKPPLFNWILIGFFKLFNRTDEFIVRLPTTLFLITYCYSIYWWVKKQLGRQSGWLAALMFLTCGRILFWDSLLGLIDITYSWLTFMNFMLIWHFYEKQKYTQLFLVSYTLMAFSFLLKGIPSVAFQGITLLTVFIYNKNSKRLFSWQHLVGIILSIVLAGTYYYFYYLNQPDHFRTLILRLFTESAQKSALGSTIEQVLKHLITFPFELIYHFFPWTLLGIFIFHKKILHIALTNRFIKYCAIVFLTNLLVYWLSPVTYPRYLLMLMPLLFIVLIYLAKFHALSDTLNYRILKRLTYAIVIVLALLNVMLPLIFANKIPVGHLYLKSIMILFAEGFVLYFFYFSQRRAKALFTLGIMLLISRVSFNLFLLPYRQSISWLNLCRYDAIEIANETRGKEMFLLTDTITIPNAYYLTRERNEILRYKDTPVAGPYYIVKDTLAYNGKFKREFSMRVPSYERNFYIGKLISEP